MTCRAFLRGLFPLCILLFTASCIQEKNEFIPLEDISISPTDAQLELGNTLQLTAHLIPDNATDSILRWTSSNKSVATVSNSGLVKAVKVGEAVISVKASQIERTCKITVKKPRVEVGSITLDQSALDLDRGKTVTLIATVLPENATDKTVSWVSNNASVATVDTEGHVTAVGSGQTTITAFAGTQSAECIVSVVVPVEKITLNRRDITVIEGASATLEATIFPDDATDRALTWVSRNSYVATVSSSGVVSAKKAGNAIIVVRSHDGRASTTCDVTVIKNPNVIPVNGVRISQTDLSIFVESSATLTATVLPENATDKNVRWKSLNPGIAEVDQSGRVRGMSVGTTTVTVTTMEQ